MNAERLDQLVAAITPSRLREMILALANKQAPSDRAGVDLITILRAVSEGEDLGVGAEGWQSFERLKAAVIAALTEIPGMRYVASSP